MRWMLAAGAGCIWRHCATHRTGCRIRRISQTMPGLCWGIRGAAIARSRLPDRRRYHSVQHCGGRRGLSRSRMARRLAASIVLRRPACHRSVIASVPIVLAPPATGHFSPSTCPAGLAPVGHFSVAAPIFLCLPPHGWRFRVLDLEPVLDATGAVMRAEALRYDALATECAGFAEYDRAFILEMVIEGLIRQSSSMSGRRQNLRPNLVPFREHSGLVNV
jgi:hypothetical protein